MPRPLPAARAGAREIESLPAFADRRAVVTGASGTGKRATLQRLAGGRRR